MLIGVVGKPNVGKSTTFKALTLAEIEIENRPFVTIKPNHGTGYVKVSCVCQEFGKQCNPRMGYCIGGYRFVPVELIDVAGLVPGAHRGEGLGAQFLNDLNRADALIHVIDASGSTNALGEPVALGSYDPANDVRFLEVELDMWYLEILGRGWKRFARQVAMTSGSIIASLTKQLSGVGVTEDMVKNAMKELKLEGTKPTEWSEELLKDLATFFRKATKPMIIACNKIDLDGALENYRRLQQDFPEYTFIATAADAELALKEAAKAGIIGYVPGETSFAIAQEDKLNDAQKGALDIIKGILEKHEGTGVQALLDSVVFNTLKYKAIYPGGVGKLEDSKGNVLPDCFLLKGTATSLDFAYHLHTDFGKHFIQAIDVKKKIPVARDYVLAHRDVIEIKSGK